MTLTRKTAHSAPVRTFATFHMRSRCAPTRLKRSTSNSSSSRDTCAARITIGKCDRPVHEHKQRCVRLLVPAKAVEDTANVLALRGLRCDKGTQHDVGFGAVVGRPVPPHGCGGDRPLTPERGCARRRAFTSGSPSSLPPSPLSGTGADPFAARARTGLRGAAAVLHGGNHNGGTSAICRLLSVHAPVGELTVRHEGADAVLASPRLRSGLRCTTCAPPSCVCCVHPLPAARLHMDAALLECGASGLLRRCAVDRRPRAGAAGGTRALPHADARQATMLAVVNRTDPDMPCQRAHTRSSGSVPTALSRCRWPAARTAGRRSAVASAQGTGRRVGDRLGGRDAARATRTYGAPGAGRRAWHGPDML